MIHARAIGARASAGPGQQRILQDSLSASRTARLRRQQVTISVAIIVIILLQLKSFSDCLNVNTKQNTITPYDFQPVQYYQNIHQQQQQQRKLQNQEQWQANNIQHNHILQYETRIGDQSADSRPTSRNMKTLGDWFKSIHNVGQVTRNHLKDAQPNKNKHFIYHHHQLQQLQQQHQPNFHSALKALPNGPPPFRPPALILGLNSFGALEKLKRTRIFKRMYKSKVYYLFIDVLRQLAELVDRIARKKIAIAGYNVAAVQAVASKLVLKGSQHLKLKWPLVMLNPNFIKEILANPTFLVMLFHTIEVAYMSMPVGFWLKPLVKLVKQPSPEKEEEVWWRRKRIYDVLNGQGSSELEPSLKTKHFRHPGEPAPFSLSELTHSIRQLTGRPQPQPAYQFIPDNNLPYPTKFQSHHREPEEAQQAFAMSPAIDEFESQQYEHHTYHDHEKPTIAQNTNAYMTGAQENSFLENQMQNQDQHKLSSASPKHQGFYQAQASSEHEHLAIRPVISDGNKMNTADPFMTNQLMAPSGEGHELMSQDEFNMLEPQEREIVLRTAQNSIAEAQLAEEIIKQQSDLVKSIAQHHDRKITMPNSRRMEDMTFGSNSTRTDLIS